MSTVWSALDLHLNGEVAVKLLDSSIAENDKALSRFLREARTIARLRSNHVIRVLDCGIDEGIPFIVMERLNGASLREKLHRLGVLSPHQTVGHLGDVARGMQAAHDKGVIHRDLKPDNIFIAFEDNTEVAKVLDFGIAKRVVGSEGGTKGVTTEVGEVFGTPSYMSPEQIEARLAVDQRTDIWALGVIAFECLVGRLPFVEDTLRELFIAICMRPMPRPSSLAAVPSGFDNWFAKATDRDPYQRFACMMDARRELLALSGPHPGHPPEIRSVSAGDTTEPAGAAVKHSGSPGSPAEADCSAAAFGVGTEATSAPVTAPGAIMPVQHPSKVARRTWLLAGLSAVLILVVVLALARRGSRGDDPRASGAEAPESHVAPSAGGSVVQQDRLPASYSTDRVAAVVSEQPPRTRRIPLVRSPPRVQSSSGTPHRGSTPPKGSAASVQTAPQASIAPRQSRIDLGLE